MTTKVTPCNFAMGARCVRHCTMLFQPSQSSDKSACFKPFIYDCAGTQKIRNEYSASHPAHFVICAGEYSIRFDLEIESTTRFDFTSAAPRGEHRRVGRDGINAFGERHTAERASATVVVHQDDFIACAVARGGNLHRIVLSGPSVM
ncbi:hypothetical protein [Stenotrophomonas rhizophila]|uniref:hypothetical protein n=1 Tax=Stenotrophomonas rhizophila TaxID=216778 RepID=UPI001E634EE0|nr:hypothetical protein [Stenotrophomonas rhizophila]MCC7635106.1 hypothetical protein [Stenotrophomonas rhizophila]MCC7664878.1 hypothetical protein [Stenotrophomonas rhizophila]